MAQDHIIYNAPDISRACQEHARLINPPEGVASERVSPPIPSVSRQVSASRRVLESEVKPKVIARVLARLSVLEFPAKDYVEEYLRHLHRRNCKFTTLSSRLGALQLFLSFLEDVGKTHIEEITRQDLEAFVEHEQDRGLSMVSVKTRLCAIYAFLRFCHDKGVVSPELLVRKIRLRLPEPLPRAIDPDDVNRLLAVLDELRDRAMILVLLRTGMRIGELLNTQVSDVNLAERKVAIYEAEKNGVGRVVYISKDALGALRAWLKKRDPNKALVFYGQGRSSLSYHGARRMFMKHLKQAGLGHKGYTLHCLRHTFASEMLNAGMRLECLQALLGHSNIEVTRRYAKLTDKTREQEYFRAMEIIERGEIDGDYRLDS
jgi:integrase/recombinase XerC/integrase/recombinase XerD